MSAMKAEWTKHLQCCGHGKTYCAPNAETLFPIFFFTSFPFSFAPIQSLIQKILLSIYRVHSLGCKILMVTRSTAPVLLLLSRDDGVCTSGQIVMSHYTLQKNVGDSRDPTLGARAPNSAGRRTKQAPERAGNTNCWARSELLSLGWTQSCHFCTWRGWFWRPSFGSESDLLFWLVSLGHHVTSFNNLFHSVFLSVCENHSCMLDKRVLVY